MKNPCECANCHYKFKNTKGLSNHLRYGCHGLPDTKETYRLKHKNLEEAYKERSVNYMDDKNPNWRGQEVGYTALHNWIKRRFAKPDSCNNCQKTTFYLDLANISQKYKRDLSDWEWLCRSCHMMKDGRMNNLKQYAIL